jgi:hypothetical protein
MIQNIKIKKKLKTPLSPHSQMLECYSCQMYMYNSYLKKREKYKNLGKIQRQTNSKQVNKKKIKMGLTSKKLKQKSKKRNRRKVS